MRYHKQHEEECSEPKPHSNVIQNEAERKSISNPALLIPSLPTGREGQLSCSNLQNERAREGRVLEMRPSQSKRGKKKKNPHNEEQKEKNV